MSSAKCYQFGILLQILVKFTLQLDTNLKLIQIVYRHGDRSPVYKYPNDAYNTSYWDKYGGLGQLTQDGMRQHYQFGFYLRNFYKNFLSIYYNRNQVFARSTDFDRTLMSTYSLLAGLFEPHDYQKFNETINWQPIAVHTTSQESDKIFYSGPCPRLDDLKQKVSEIDEYLNVENEFKGFFELVSEKSGINPIDIYNFWEVGDAIFVEKTHNLTLPDWASSNYNKIMKLVDIGFYFDYFYPEMAKLGSGGVLNDMVKNIQNKIVNDSSYQLFLYGAHDTYIAALTKLLNISTYINQPPYASAIIMELRQANDNSYYVQVFLKNNTATEEINLRTLTIFGCEQLCPIETFFKIISDKVVNDFTIACESQDKHTVKKANSFITNATYLVIAIIVCLVVILVVVGAIINYFSMKRSSQSRFNPL